MNYWRDKSNHRKQFEDYARFHGFDPLIAANWYSITWQSIKGFTVKKEKKKKRNKESKEEEKEKKKEGIVQLSLVVFSIIGGGDREELSRAKCC